MIPEKLIRIGILSRPHGIDGTMLLRLSGNFEDELLEREFLFVSIDSTMIPFSIEDLRIIGDSAFVRFSEIDLQEKTYILRGKEAFIPRKSNTKSVELQSFKGFAAKDETSGKEGQISGFFDTGNNPLFALESENHEYLIPANPDFFVSVDKKQRILTLRLPDGIFELDD